MNASLDDMRIVKQRYVDELLREGEEPVTTGEYERYPEQMLEPAQMIGRRQVRQYIRGLSSSGRWRDIDYGAAFVVEGKLTPTTHLTRILLLARAYRIPRFGSDGEIGRAALAALGYWLKHDFGNDQGWWWYRLGVQKWLFRIYVLLETEAPAAQRNKVLEILARSMAHPYMTGQNLIWSREIAAVQAILEEDAARAERHYRRIAREVRITRQEGIQPDFSFHQHGACLYSHGYGKSFAADASRIAGLVFGTRFAFPPEKIQILTSYILDGQQWMARGAFVDYGAVGRRTGRRHQTAGHLHDISLKMLKFATGREAEFQALAQRASGRDGGALVGNRHYWRSDMMTHHRRRFYTSARMYSRRVFNTDNPYGGTGLMNHHIADGCNFVCRTGGEYYDIFPVWDWQKVPGTTVGQCPAFFSPDYNSTPFVDAHHPLGPRQRGQRSFVGGVSDGMYGLAAFDFARGSRDVPDSINLTARKAWFFFDNEYVCLGAGISCEGDNPVATTVNQCFLTGRVTVATPVKQRVLAEGEHNFENLNWVHHDGIGYVLAQPASVRVSNMLQTGNWRRINACDTADDVAHEVFKLWIDHGARPQNASYCYAVLPGIASDELAGQAKALPIQILGNAPHCQAVRHRKLKLTGIAFYRPGRMALGQGLVVGVDRPCLLLLRERAESICIAVADPARHRRDVTVTITRRLKGSNVSVSDRRGSRCVFSLPGGIYAGASVQQEFAVCPPSGRRGCGV